MSDKLRVLSIDDNHQNLNLLQQALEMHFDVISSPGDEPIGELVLDCEPDIILLDIMLTDTSGYDVCRELRSMTLPKEIIVIFISSLNSLEDKLKAYEAGGDDYICKPVNLAELEYKLEAYEKRIHQQNELEQQMEEASLAAFASMQQSSELGLLIEFFTNSLTIDTFDELYEATSSVILSFRLICSVEFRTEHHIKQYPLDNVSQLESEILELGKRAKRIVPFGKNILFNSRQCSLLIKNLPTDETLLGRVKDHLVILLEIINSRILYIQSEENRRRVRKTAIEALKTGVNDSFNQVNIEVCQLEKQLDVVFDELEQTLRSKLINIGVNRSLESDVATILAQTKSRLDTLMASSIDIDDKLITIDRLLQNID
ncbi:MAG: response regulator [Algicola sp.]|nr:response regulator [Algicola sp.]